jgi:hypothetical protein
MEAGNTLRQIADVQKFTVSIDKAIQLKPEDYAAIAAFQREAAQLSGSFESALSLAEGTQKQLQSIIRRIDRAPAADPSFAQTAVRLNEEVEVILDKMKGSRLPWEYGQVSIFGYKSTATMNIAGFSRPTQTELESYANASRRLSEEIEKLRKLTDVDLTELHSKLQAAGIAWTPVKTPPKPVSRANSGVLVP